MLDQCSITACHSKVRGRGLKGLQQRSTEKGPMHDVCHAHVGGGRVPGLLPART